MDALLGKTSRRTGRYAAFHFEYAIIPQWIHARLHSSFVRVHSII